MATVEDENAGDASAEVVEFARMDAANVRMTTPLPSADPPRDDVQQSKGETQCAHCICQIPTVVTNRTKPDTSGRKGHRYLSEGQLPIRSLPYGIIVWIGALV